MYNIYIDGGCSNGKGAYSIVLMKEKELVVKYTASVENTTNNQMELSAYIVARFIISRFGLYKTTIYCDSQYVVKGVKEYLENWEKNKWRNSINEPIKNLPYWSWIYKDSKEKDYNTQLVHIKGHSGNTGNEIADKLCTYQLKSSNPFYIFRLASSIDNTLFSGIGYNLSDARATLKTIKLEQDSSNVNNEKLTHGSVNFADTSWKVVLMPQALQQTEGHWIIFEGFPAKIIPLND